MTRSKRLAVVPPVDVPQIRNSIIVRIGLKVTKAKQNGQGPLQWAIEISNAEGCATKWLREEPPSRAIKEFEFFCDDMSESLPPKPGIVTIVSNAMDVVNEVGDEDSDDAHDGDGMDQDED